MPRSFTAGRLTTLSSPTAPPSPVGSARTSAHSTRSSPATPRRETATSRGHSLGVAVPRFHSRPVMHVMLARSPERAPRQLRRFPRLLAQVSRFPRCKLTRFRTASSISARWIDIFLPVQSSSTYGPLISYSAGAGDADQPSLADTSPERTAQSASTPRLFKPLGWLLTVFCGPTAAVLLTASMKKRAAHPSVKLCSWLQGVPRRRQEARSVPHRPCDVSRRLRGHKNNPCLRGSNRPRCPLSRARHAGRAR